MQSNEKNQEQFQEQLTKWLSSQNPYLTSRKKFGRLDEDSARHIWEGQYNLEIPCEMMAKLNLEETLGIYAGTIAAKKMIQTEPYQKDKYQNPENFVDLVHTFQKFGYFKIRKNHINWLDIYASKKGEQIKRLKNEISQETKKDFAKSAIQFIKPIESNIYYQNKTVFLNMMYAKLSKNWEKIAKNIEYKPELFSDEFLGLLNKKVYKQL